MPKLPEIKRKNPTQERSKETVEIIFEATAQLLEGDEEEKISTNKIAKKAGFSIGTLYQYFPNLDSLIVSMAYHERDRVKLLISDIFNDTESKTSKEIILKVVCALLGAFKARQKLRKHLIMAVFKTGNFKPFIEAQDEVVYFIIEKIQSLNREDIRPLEEMTGYIMSRSLMGVIRSAVLEDSSAWKNPAFEQDLVHMVYQYLCVVQKN